MDSNDIFSELIYVGDKQDTTLDLVKKNADVLEAIKEKVSVQPEPPVVVVPDTVVVSNFPDTQKVEVINHEKVDLTSVEELLSKLVEIVPSIKDDKPAEAIDKLSKLLSEDQTDKKILELLRAILDKEYPVFPEQVPFEIPDNLISKDGRIKVEVDRAGGGGGGSTQVDISTLATSAGQATMVGHIDGIETLLTTIEANQLPDGHNVTIDNVSIPVTGTFWQATQPVSGTVTANATLAAETTKVIGTVNVSTGQTITEVPATSGGLSKFHLVGAGTTNATNIKASAGQVYSITAFNIGATPIYVKFHNTAGTPTAGSGVTDTYLIPGNTSGAGMVINIDKGVSFSTGIGITTVTGITDASTVAIAADTLVLNIYYK